MLSALGVAVASSSPSLAHRAPASNQTAPATQRTLVMTVDDLPGALPGNDFAVGDLKVLQKINRGIPATLKAHHAWAVGFVNERKLQVLGERDARAELLQMWLDNGLTLGNHTYEHTSFNATTLQKFEDETIRGEVVTRVLMKAAGQDEKYFRHPYLNTGPNAEAKAAFEQFLKDRNYVVAPVTIDDGDYAFNDVLAYAREKKDKKLEAKAKQAYLDYVDKVFDYFEGLALSDFNRPIPQVFLVHDNEINLECLDALLTKLEKRGYKFISLDQALADPAYATPDLYIGEGMSWLEKWKIALNLKMEKDKGPDLPDWTQKIFDDMRKERQKNEY
ncbi:MAG TPA: polysaccharide deacetylase family protein [Candidatus Acidoferrales bacterium]